MPAGRALHVLAPPHCFFFAFVVLRCRALRAEMATTYENMCLKETYKREDHSKIEWARQNAPDSSLYNMDSMKNVR